MINKHNKIDVEFCNVKMKLRYCQFKHFHYYLMRISEKLTSEINTVDLLLVKDNLNITISLNHFLQLLNAVKGVMTEKFGYKNYIE